jgi:hypothetical protein
VLVPTGIAIRTRSGAWPTWFALAARGLAWGLAFATVFAGLTALFVFGLWR